jgi:hypothetical protein
VRRRARKVTGSRSLIEGLRRAPEWIDFLSDSPRLAACGIADAGQWRLALSQATVGQTHGDAFLLAGIAVEVFLRDLEAFRVWLATRHGAQPSPAIRGTPVA